MFSCPAHPPKKRYDICMHSDTKTDRHLLHAVHFDRGGLQLAFHHRSTWLLKCNSSTTISIFLSSLDTVATFLRTSIIKLSSLLCQSSSFVEDVYSFLFCIQPLYPQGYQKTFIMFLFSTLALSILGTFACDGLDINSFVTWYWLYICNTIQNPTMPPSFLFHPWQICNVTKEEHFLLAPILHFFLHRPNVLYL